MILLNQMIILFMMAVTGIFCRKFNILNDEASKKLSSLVVNIANPALILSASINQSKYLEGSQLIMTFMLAILMFVVLMIIAKFLPFILRVDAKDQGIYKAMLVFSNMGFMGFPVISATYGSNALLLASMFLVPFNVLIYTYGISIMNQSEHKEKFQIRKVLNIGVIACVISIIIYLSRLHVPAPVESFIKSMSNLTAPLSMIIIGDSMAKMDLKKLFTNVRLIVFSIIKLIIVPVAGVFLLKWIGIDATLLGVCMVILATPAASMTAMLAQEYNGDYELASQGVAITTVLCIVTIPLVSFITGV